MPPYHLSFWTHSPWWFSSSCFPIQSQELDGVHLHYHICRHCLLSTNQGLLLGFCPLIIGWRETSPVPPSIKLREVQQSLAFWKAFWKTFWLLNLSWLLWIGCGSGVWCWFTILLLVHSCVLWLAPVSGVRKLEVVFSRVKKHHYIDFQCIIHVLNDKFANFPVDFYNVPHQNPVSLDLRPWQVAATEAVWLRLWEQLIVSLLVAFLGLIEFESRNNELNGKIDWQEKNPREN